MKFIGLAGPAGVGKDTIADYLVETYNYTKFSFSDALYDEVATAFGINKAALYERSTKEKATPALQYWHCADHTFRNLIFHLLVSEGVAYPMESEGVAYPMDRWLSPRWVLQRWGTDYRRKEDPEYWTKRADLFVEAYLRNAAEYPEVQRGGLVNCSVRFPNEREWVQKHNGEVWHVVREDYAMNMQESQRAYVSELGLSVEPEDKIIYNNGTIEQLCTGTSLLLSAPGGSSIKVAQNSPRPELVTCKNCGLVHAAYTRAEAAQEAIEFNETVGYHADSAMLARLVQLSADDYIGCDRCDGNDFRPATPDEKLGDDHHSVIYD